MSSDVCIVFELYETLEMDFWDFLIHPQSPRNTAYRASVALGFLSRALTIVNFYLFNIRARVIHEFIVKLSSRSMLDCHAMLIKTISFRSCTIRLPRF